MNAAPTDRPPRRRRLAVAAAIAAAIVVVLLGSAVALLPHLVDTDAARRAIAARISALAGGDVRYDSLSVKLFPQPRAELRGVAINVPGTVEGKVGAVDLRIALLPLLAGRVHPVAIRIEQPALTVFIAPGGGSDDPLAAYRAAVGPVVDALAREAQGMSFAVDGGRLDVLYAGKRVVALADLTVAAQVETEAIDADVSGTSDLWRATQGHLRIVPGSLAATAKLQVGGLDAVAVLAAIGAESALQVRRGTIDASLTADTDGRDAVRASLTASSPQLVVARGARVRDLGPLRVTADGTRAGGVVTLSLRTLQLGELVAGAAGSLRAKSDGAAVELQVPALDLVRLRDAAAALAGDLDAVKTAAAMIAAGTARGLALSAAASNLAALAELRSVRAEAQLEGATLAFEDFGITIRDGAGRFVLADGAVTASGLAGRIGKSSFSGGTLTAPLVPAAALHDLHASVDADLAEVLAIARHATRRRDRTLLADLAPLQGRASGTVAYDHRRRSPHVVLEAATVRATGRYRGVPFPIAVTRGAFRYDGENVRLRGLEGTLGRSRVQNGALEMGLGRELMVHSAGADTVLALDELYPWLASFEGLRPALKELTTVTGTAAVRIARLSGPFDAPAALDFEAVVQPQDVRLTGPALPAALTVSRGQATITARTLQLENLEAAMLDARVTASGTMQDYASSDRRADLTFASGTAGQQAIDWARARWQLPAKGNPRAPLALDSGRLQLPGGANGGLAAQGTVRLAGDARAEFDLAWQPGSLDLRRFALKDADSDLTAALKWAPATAEVSFRGTLDNRSFARILAQSAAAQGSLRGDFRAAVDLKSPRRSTASGSLQGNGLDLLDRWDLPVIIDRISLDAKGDAVRISDSVVRIGGERLELSGTVENRPETFAIDARVSAEALDAAKLIAALPARAPRAPGTAWDLPVEGRVALSAGSIAYGEFTVRPVVATASLALNRVTVDVTEARLCGIAVPLAAVLTPGNVAVNGRIEARGQPLDQTATCLTGDNVAMTGTVEFDADFTASGPPAALVRSARGKFRGSASNGRIQRAPAITRILLLNDVASLLRAGPSQVMAGGLAYQEITGAGTLEGEVVHIERVTMDSVSLGLAMSGDINLADRTVSMRGLVAPFAGVGAVFRRVPIVGNLFGTHIIGIPISVSGPMHDPTVLPLGAAAVGDGIVNLLGATLKAPIELLDPLLGRSKPAP